MPCNHFLHNFLLEPEKYNFTSARLGINLLGISHEEAERIADIHFEMAIKSEESGWSLMDAHFKAFHSVLSAKNHEKRFNFFCRGFTDTVGRILYYNMDMEKVNLLCHYVTDANINLDEVDYEIYHPTIFEKGLNYLKNRFETFRRYCASCEIAGICRGGCVITGLDSYNRLNEAACVFLRKTWRNYITLAYSRQNEIKTKSPAPPTLR